MHRGIEIHDGIYWIGVNDYETNLFEGLWPLPKGVSYNAYMIIDEKVALVDTVKGSYFSQYLDRVKALLPEGKSIDYLVINHMEPDHSGAIKVLVEAYPRMKIVGNKKTIQFLEGFYGITKNTVTIEDGEVLSLGTHKLKFYLTPMVHWPETMMTYDLETGTLFSGDAFGGFGALNGGIFDNQVDLEYYEDEILRYFSNIVGRYSAMVQRAFKKLEGIDIKTIAATHGPIWRKNPEKIISLYDQWSKQEAEEGVVLVYGSMYGNTQRMMEAVAKGLCDEGVQKIRLHNIAKSHISFVIRDIWKFKGLIMGSCTYNTELFPPMKQLISAIENRMMKNRYVGVFGSYSWSGGALKELEEFASNNKGWNFIEPVIEAQHSPKEEELKKCKLLGTNMAKAIRKSL
ncbi:MAG: FprA family A-type flavoprotein [Kosmotoga sp.]|uniref:FprA family A-type flavoprotein n=1 Tax=Kosmotoga sp. TaxID=1955248 RepID=UPI001D2FA936|nr:FprA family A-type flavoprotein [Kosmotoga sp.]MBO8166521.1 FprA family A-type flavoprotein [Kosmotoga sp.]